MNGRITAVEHCLESGIDAMRKSLIELMNRMMNIRETPQSSAVTVNLSLEEFRLSAKKVELQSMAKIQSRRSHARKRTLKFNEFLRENLKEAETI
ncbi:hypothetical protein L195_g012412 [Trifolium pratense]|uniref:Uncharacterized protein n=1 Tax=Trifolium pratense TaxID=57577 RepID=A0A2K3PKA8_TRIPR|nr:hypothetical protein L195_g012412 [Trifolium pratense]